MYNGKLVIVSLTTWTKRIGNVHKTIDCILKQTVPPDTIELNLSLVEFPDKEDSFPEDFQLYAKQHSDILHINYVEGNTKAFKKIIPTVQKYYGKDYYLLSVDDDCLYREDYIEMMLKKFTTMSCDFMCMRDVGMAGSRMVYKSDCFKPDFWEEFVKLPKSVVDKSVDDSYYFHYLGKHRKKLGNFKFPIDFKDIFSFHDEIDSLHEVYRKPGYMDTINDAMHKLEFKQ